MAVQLMRFECRLQTEMPEASTTPKPLVVPRLVAHKRAEAFIPGVVLIQVEQIYALLECLLGDVVWLTGARLIILEGEHDVH